MPRVPSRYPTDLELEILKSLWERGSLTVRQIQEALAPERSSAYTTIATMLTIMIGKGYVRRERTGQVVRYVATVERQDCAQGMLQDVVDRVFEGSISAVVQQLIETSDLNADELKAIRQLVTRRTKESGT